MQRYTCSSSDVTIRLISKPTLLAAICWRWTNWIWTCWWWSFQFVECAWLYRRLKHNAEMSYRERKGGSHRRDVQNGMHACMEAFSCVTHYLITVTSEHHIYQLRCMYHWKLIKEVLGIYTHIHATGTIIVLTNNNAENRHKLSQSGVHAMA